MSEENSMSAVAVASLLSKKFKKARVYVGTDQYPDVKRASSGLIGLDKMLGGGIPQGRVIQLWGSPSAGKSTLASKIIETHIKLNHTCLYLDLEKGTDKETLERLGIIRVMESHPTNPLIFVQPSNGEDAIGMAIMTMEATPNACIVIDSVPCLLPSVKMEVDPTDLSKAHVSPVAQLLSKTMGMLTDVCNLTGGTVIFINQVREKVGVSYGNPEYRPGGKYLEHNCSVILRVRKGKDLDNGSGTTISVKAIKNRTGIQNSSTEMSLYFSDENGHTAGLDPISNLEQVAEELGLITKAGPWYSFSEEALPIIGLEPTEGSTKYKIGQGVSKVNDYLRENKDVFDRLYQHVLTK